MTLIKSIITPDGQKDVPMTADEEAAFLAEQATNQAAQAILDLKSQAQKALDKSDLTALRCIKAGVTFPAEWQAYVKALRGVVDTGNGPLPSQPAYPAGT